MPEQVSGAMSEIVADMREGLLALALGAGLQVMAQLMEADVTAACGPRGQHCPDRTATRHGTERGSVTLGGRRVPITRPRVRAVDGRGERPVPAYEVFNGTELLGRMAMERMLAGVSTRRYPVALEPVGKQVEQDARSTSKSAVSRKFVAMTEHALADLLAKDLTDLDMVARMIDGVPASRADVGGGVVCGDAAGASAVGCETDPDEAAAQACPDQCTRTESLIRPRGILDRRRELRGYSPISDSSTSPTARALRSYPSRTRTWCATGVARSTCSIRRRSSWSTARSAGTASSMTATTGSP